MARKKRPVSDVEYTGLTDTATGYSGSTTLDSSVDIGSPLPLVVASDRNQGIDSPHNQFFTSTYDLWDNPNPGSSLKLSGVSDPPFASASLSTPYPSAVQTYGSMNNALLALPKYGFGIAALMGNHPTTITPSPSKVHGAKAGAIPVSNVPSGHLTLGVVIVVVALGLLLLNE